MSDSFLGEATEQVDGLPVTSVERSILELGVACQNRWVVVNACHEAAFFGRFRIDAMHRLLSACSRRHGLAVVRDAVELHERGGATTASDAERRLLELLITMGTPRARMNHWISVHGVAFPLDAYWPELNACIEYDGPAHGRVVCQVDDRTRDRLLEHHGTLRLRIDAADLTIRRGRLVRQIWAMLHEAAASRGVSLDALPRF